MGENVGVNSAHSSPSLRLQHHERSTQAAALMVREARRWMSLRGRAAYTLLKTPPGPLP